MVNKLNSKYYNNQVFIVQTEAAVLQTLIRISKIQNAIIGTSIVTKKKDNDRPCFSNSCSM
jgi:ribosomal protein S6